MPSWLARAAIAVAFLAALPVSALPQSSSGSGSSSTACNNSPSLCNRNYNNITHMGAHGSSFVTGDEGISAAANQNYNASAALDAGLRLLQAQVHEKDGTLTLCHTSCSFMNSGPLEDWLSAINYWMSSNPNEVVTLLLVNSDHVKASRFGSLFKSSGISKIGYEPSSEGPTGDWPTLKSMISDKKRLVSFVTNIDATTDYPYLLPEFDYVFETAYEVPELSGFNCSLDRPSKLDSASDALSSNYLSLMNHFKYKTLGTGTDNFIPDVENIDIVNSANTTEDGELGLHAKTCKSEWGSAPNFVLVDFFEKGDVLAVADSMNGISGATGRTEATDDESMGSLGSKNFGTGALIACVAGIMLLV